jgi:hypothetical protein
MTESVALIFAGLGALAALVFGLRAQKANADAARAWAESEKLSVDLKAVREQLGKQSGKLAKHDDEVADLRRRLDKAKRRASTRGSSAGAAGGAGGAGDSLEQESDLEEARQSRDSARREAEGLSAEVQRLRAEVASLSSTAPPEEDPRIEELGQAKAKAIADLAASEEALAELRKGKARLKKKLDTQELLYVSMRSELDIKKDRLRAQQEIIERLQALEVSLGGTTAAGSEPLPGAGDASEPAPDLDLDPAFGTDDEAYDEADDEADGEAGDDAHDGGVAEGAEAPEGVDPTPPGEARD